MAKTKAKPETWLHKNERLLKIAKWCRDGYTNTQIAEKIGISYSTFARWYDLEVVPEETDLPYRQVDFKGTFADYLIYAREADDEVEAALKKQATGYWIEEQYLDKKGKPKTVRRWIPPSDKALAMWLKNRRVTEWNKESESININAEAQEAVAIDFFIKQKVQVDDLKDNKEQELNTDANNEQ